MNLLATHPTACLIGLYLFTAAVSSLPRPGTPFDAYACFYHFLLQLLNAVPQQYRMTRPGDDSAQP